MKLWYLDNEHLDFIIVAETREEAWQKLYEQCQILPPESDEDESGNGECHAAYNDIFEITSETKIDNPHDLDFVL